MKKILFLILIINCKLSIINSLAQGINNRFLFGHDDPQYNPRRNIDITNNAVSQDSTPFSLAFDAASANISDSAGNLLFYSDGYQVMNKLHLPMQGIDTLSPGIGPQMFFDQGTNANQSVMILPIPNQNHKYYIFSSDIHLFANNTLSQTFNLQYSVIDMNLNGGLGACTQANTTIISDTLRNGGLTVCRHANGRDWWLPVKQWNNNKFYMLLITPNGIQNMGEQAIGDTTCKVVDWSGQTAFSPDGHWYANNDAKSDLNLYEFDRCTGTFTSSLHVPILDSIFYFGGVAFSPNSKVFYYTNGYDLYQLNLDTSNIAASKRHIAHIDGFYDGAPYYRTYFLYGWLAPNNKIYINTSTTTRYFHTINYPDNLGQACGFLQHNVNFNCNNQRTIPNHYNYFLGAESGTICDSLGITVNLPNPSNVGSFARGVRVNPNPANAGFYFNYNIKEHSTLQITNNNGAIVHTQTLYSWFGYVQIDCSDWANGVYSYKAGNNSGKIVVLH
jgi:hypothetical protein